MSEAIYGIIIGGVIVGIFQIANTYLSIKLNAKINKVTSNLEVVHSKVNGLNEIIAAKSEKIGFNEGVKAQEEKQEQENNKK